MRNYLERFRSYLEAELGLAVGSVTGYVFDVDEFLTWAGPTGEPFSGDLVDRFLRALATRGLQPSTLNRKRMAVRSFYTFLSRMARLDPVQLSLIDPIKQSRRMLDVLEPAQIEALCAACTGEAAQRDRTIIQIMSVAGIRASELCGLDLRDVHGASCRLKVMGKGRVERMVPITGRCLKAIEDYVGAWRTRHANGTPALFIKLDGGRMTRLAVTDMISRLCVKAGLPHSTSHTLRRSCATAMLNAGAQVEAVQEHLGHRSIDSTQQYLALSRQRLFDVYRRCHPKSEAKPVRTRC